MMTKRLAIGLLAAAFFGFGVFWWLSAPKILQPGASTGVTELDLVNGERIFWASGCASCHAKKGAKEAEKLLLGGDHRLDTPFGTFVTPNISSDAETGIGAWTQDQFINAMVSGISPDGEHYYPAFPFSSYNKMLRADLLDLFGFLKTLPAVSRANSPHELGIAFSWRRPLGVWKLLFAQQDWQLEIDESDQKLLRGRYLVEALGHCAECHTPRNPIGGLKSARWLAGGAAPEGGGKIPNITPHDSGIGSWSEGDIVYYLESGFTPDFDSVGGTMTSVQQNMAKLPKADLEAIAAYLKAVPAVASD